MNRTRSHQWIDRRSLALATAIARKIERDPVLFRVGEQNLRRWRKHIVPWPPALQEWEAILKEGSEHALQQLVEDSVRGRRLRQSNPFAGVLDPSERNAILTQYESIPA